MIPPRPFPPLLIAKVWQQWQLPMGAEFFSSVRVDRDAMEVGIRTAYTDGREDWTVLPIPHAPAPQGTNPATV